MTTTSETVAKAQQLAVEVRVRAGMMASDYRRGNITRLRRAHRYAENLARLAADLGATAFQAADLLAAELRTARNKVED